MDFSKWLARVMLLLVTLCCPAAYAQESVWRDDLSSAIEESVDKPMVLLFSTESCVWCKRLIADSEASAAVKQLLSKITGIVVDANKHPALVAQLGIQSYPTMVLVNRKKNIVRTVEGYVPEADLVTTLKVLLLHGDDEKGQPAPFAAPVDVEAITKKSNAVELLIPLLGVGFSEQRLHVRSALGKMPAARAALFTSLNHAQLGVRIDAAAALEILVGPYTNYDPLSVGEERLSAINAWEKQTTTALPGGITP
jgi:thioredoxin-related protein